MKPTFTFDLPSGVFKSTSLTQRLYQMADRPGPVLYQYGAVRFDSLDGLCSITDLAITVLLYQLRGLRILFPGIQPELRVAMPTNYGRSRLVVWYCDRIDTALLGEDGNLVADINPADIL